MQDRIKKLQSLISSNNLDAILVSSVPNIIYLAGSNWGFSKDEREAFLFIARAKQYILTDGRYSEVVRQQVKDFELIEIPSGFSFEKALKEIIKKQKIKRLGFEGHNITFLEHKNLSKLTDIQHLNPNSLRVIKEPKEILNIEEACKLGDKTFDYILKKIKKGISEKELAFEIEFFVKKHGADISFPPIVAFGKNSAIPHHVPSNRKLKTDNIVLLDFGVKLNNYCSDMTRTVFFGKATAEFKKMYKTVLDAQQKSIDCLQKRFYLGGGRMDSSEVDRTARDYITSKGYPTIPHGLGHGIGLEVHETPRLSPTSKDILRQGMVFSIEPGIYLPNFGGVRIEDLVVLEKESLRLLTHSSREIIEI